MTIGSSTESLLGRLSGAVDGAAAEAGWLARALAEDGPRLRATCRALTDSDAEADDLLQETLLRALTRPPVDLERPVLPWLRTVARHLATDARRVRGRVEPEVDVDALGDDPTDDTEAARAVDEALVGAVAQLGLAQLSAFLLQTLLGLSADEVAEAVGRTPGNVRVLTHRARETLRTGSPQTDDGRRRAVAAFLEQVCAAKVTGLAELLRASRPAHDLPAGAIGAVLRGRAARVAWERLVAAAGAILGPERDAPAHLWSRAAALEEAGDWSGAADLYERAVKASRERGLDALAARALLGLARQAVTHGEPRGEVPSEVPDELRLQEGTLRGGRLWRQGELASATAVYDRLLEGTLDAETRGALLHNLALVDIYGGQLQAARERAQEALALHRASGNVQYESRTLNALGMAAQNVGALGEARTWFEQAREVLETAGLQRDGAGIRCNLGLVAQELGDLREAARWFHEALALARTHHLPRSEAIALANLGVNHHLAGRPARARDALREAARIVRPLEHPSLQAFVHAHLAAATAGDEPEASRAELARCRDVAEQLGDGPTIALIGLLEAHVALTADPDDGHRRVEEALAGVTGPGPDGSEPWVRRSVVVRIGAELLRRAFSTGRA